MGQGDERTSAEERLLLDVKEVSALLHLGERTIWKLNAMGEFAAPVRIGRSVRWDRREIEAWLAEKNAEAQKKQERIRKSP
ncbi:helix-turn-helix transcriptional regulator [Planctomycetota bacterium]